jgi:hypothetical protein
MPDTRKFVIQELLTSLLPCETVCTSAYGRFQLTYQLPFVIILQRFLGAVGSDHGYPD